MASSTAAFFSTSKKPPSAPLLLFGDNHLSTVTNTILIQLIPELKKLKYVRYYGEFEPREDMRTPQKMLDHLQKLEETTEQKSEHALFTKLKEYEFVIKGVDADVDALKQSRAIMQQHGGPAEFYKSKSEPYMQELMPLIKARDKAMAVMLYLSAINTQVASPEQLACAKIGALHFPGIYTYIAKLAEKDKLAPEAVPLLYFYIYEDKNDWFANYAAKNQLKFIQCICTQEISQEKIVEGILNAIKIKVDMMQKTSSSETKKDNDLAIDSQTTVPKK